MKTFVVKTVEDWHHVAEAVALSLVPGTIVTLSGPLGAGKTTFTQALANVLGAKRIPKSPTFSLVRHYPLFNHKHLRALVHVDAYRIEHPEDIVPLDLDAMLDEPGTILVVEWPEQMEGWLKKRTRIIALTIKTQDETRIVTIS